MNSLWYIRIFLGLVQKESPCSLITIGEPNLSSRTITRPHSHFVFHMYCPGIERGFRDVKSATYSLKYGRGILLKWTLKAGFIWGNRKLRWYASGYPLTDVKSPRTLSRLQHVTSGVVKVSDHYCCQLQATAPYWGWQCLISGDITVHFVSQLACWSSLAEQCRWSRSLIVSHTIYWDLVAANWQLHVGFSFFIRAPCMRNSFLKHCHYCSEHACGGQQLGGMIEVCIPKILIA